MKSSKVMGENLSKATNSTGTRVQAVTNANFSEAWNGITESYVAIHTHGSPNGLYGDDLGITTNELSKLEANANIKCVIITACETGGANGGKDNVGQVLSKKIAPNGFAVCSTTVVSGGDTNFTSTNSGVWQVYQNGTFVMSLSDSTITMESVIASLYPD